MKIDTALLAAQPFLKGLTRSQLEMLSKNALEVQFLAGRIIFKEGLPANRFYLILQGEVALESAAGNRRHAPDLIQTIKAGEVLGWSWLFPPYQWNFDARAVKPTTAIIFVATNLRRHCADDPGLGREFLRRVSQVVIQRLQATRRRLLGQQAAPAA